MAGIIPIETADEPCKSSTLKLLEPDEVMAGLKVLGLLSSSSTWVPSESLESLYCHDYPPIGLGNTSSVS